ncbi:lipopolysaccharide transport periplasmic protein LptA [Marinomonas flavescens]|uniref:lipopolysaccharide transport periplasmic protein LptA n=1 Tax=Marinomonas flavescens TaxID=2529379 RepID=UPI001054E9C4|nr:lipopolysaccharide transport periplasmic protein LptA [Marinomonas flavescens]
MKQLINISALLAGLIISQHALALPDDLSKPLTIQSNEAFLDQKTGIATYKGDVFVKQGSIEIQAQFLKVTTDPKTRKFSKLVATGKPAKFSQQIDWNGNMMISRGEQINYEVTSSTLDISGNAYLNRMDDKITADHILYHIDTGTFNAQKQGSGRVSMTLQPADDKKEK